MSTGATGGGAKLKSPQTADELRAHHLANHGRMIYRASMDEEGLNLPIVVGKDGFIADTRINNCVPRKDDETAKHAWSIPPVETFQVRVTFCFFACSPIQARILILNERTDSMFSSVDQTTFKTR